jgi:hypothetical protein
LVLFLEKEENGLTQSFTEGTPPDPLGRIRRDLGIGVSSIYSLKPRRATGVWGLAPRNNPNPKHIYSSPQKAAFSNNT